MKDFEVHLSLDGKTRLVGYARSNRARGKEIVHFEYADEWLTDADLFALEPSLPLTRGGTPLPGRRSTVPWATPHPILGDGGSCSAPSAGRRRARGVRYVP